MTQGSGSKGKQEAVRLQRRSIVFADLVESVRLMQDHEADAIDRWRRFVGDVRERLLPALGGRLVRTAGDGLLIECERPAPAVAAAFAVHGALHALNEGRPADEHMRLRVGIHHAEVLFDEFEAYGSGVNLAQRLSGLAAPGGTIVSAEARDDLVDGVHARIDDLGPRFVKHLSEPVRAFAVRPAGSAEPAPPAAGRAEDLRPTIAVVPFSALPADPEHDALGHAMADDIIATLSRHPELRVLSRLTTAGLRDTWLEPAQMLALTGATFVLSGRFYVRGQRIRLAAELSEVRGGSVLWTGQHHADIDALFEGADELVPQLVSQVTQQVLAHELSRVRSLPTDSLASYSLFLGASGLVNSLAPHDFARAHETLMHLSDRHPRQAAVQAMLSNWHFLRLLQGWSSEPDGERERLQAHARRALDLDPDLPDALVASGVASILESRDFDTARRCYLRALELNPQHPMAWARLSETQRIAGEADAAQQSAERALALSPLDPQRFIYESFASSAALDAGRHDDAQRHARASLRRHLLFAPPHRVLICALWLSGDEDGARAAAAEALRCIPGLTVSGRIGRQPGAAPLDHPYARAQLAAGIPR